MKILFIGDVVGEIGCKALAATLPSVKQEYGAQLVIVNGENSAQGNGIDARSAAAIFDAGADVVTTGNHSFQRSSINEEYERLDTLLRPANFGESLPGKGVCELDFGSFGVTVVNLIGTVFMQPSDNPFKCAEELLSRINSRIIIVDFHAEATSEKRAMGCFLSGKVSAVFGTHTHVQTADEQIMDGTGYITDVGMCGSMNGVLGIKTECIRHKFTVHTPVRFEEAVGDEHAHGAVFDIDPSTGKCTEVKAVKF